MDLKTQREDGFGSSQGTLGLLRLAMAVGLAYGLAEALIFCLFSLIPGALAWRTGNSPTVLLVAPVVYGLTYPILCLPVIALSLLIRRFPWDAVLLWLLASLSGFLAASLQGQVFSNTASILLGVGFGTVALRSYRAHKPAVTRVLPRLVPLLGGTTLVLGGMGMGLPVAIERWRMARLPAPPVNATNVLLLVIDTQRADHLSLYGYGRPTSPRITQLASESVRFDAAISPSSWTLPSHAGMLTGRTLEEHRAGELRHPYLGGEFPTLAEAMASEGYATAGFVANTFWTGRQTHLNRGFLHYEDFYANLGDAVSRTVLGRRLTYDILPQFGFIDIPGRKRAPEINHDFLTWLSAHPERPFFAFLNYMDVHGPCLPPPPFLGRFSPGGEAPKATSIELGAVDDNTTVPDQATLARWINSYDESVLSVDAAIGDLMDALRSQGLLDRTLIILTSDHGESFGEHGMIYHGNSLYPEQIHVPLVIRLPGGLQKGRVVTAPVSLREIPATVAAVTGHANGFPGASLLDSLGSGSALAEVGFRPQVPRSWPSAHGWLKSLVTEQWQYIQKADSSAELYARATDPGSEHDLAQQTESSGVLREFRAAIAPFLPRHGH